MVRLCACIILVVPKKRDRFDAFRIFIEHVTCQGMAYFDVVLMLCENKAGLSKTGFRRYRCTSSPDSHLCDSILYTMASFLKYCIKSGTRKYIVNDYKPHLYEIRVCHQCKTGKNIRLPLSVLLRFRRRKTTGLDHSHDHPIPRR